MQRLLESDDPRLAERGLQALRSIESVRLTVAELELSHTIAGMEALVLQQLSKLRIRGERQDHEVSFETVSVTLSQMAADPAGQDKPDAPASGPEAEATPGPTT